MSILDGKERNLQSLRGFARRVVRRDITESELGVSLIIPTLLVFGVIVIFPLLFAIYLGFHSTSGFSMTLQWSGLSNYNRLFSTSDFWVSLKNNVVWALGTMTLQIVLGVAIALLLHRDFKGRKLFRGAVLFPYMVPTIVAVFNFRWIFNATYGVFNYIIVTAGLVDDPIVFFGYDHAMTTAVLLGVWRFTPFVVITVLARLQTIPPSLYEAAELDGAYKLAKFRYVTLPQLYNILVIVILLRSVWMFKKFAPIYLLTGGGPGISTQILPIYAYIEAYQGLSFGYAAAIANVMFIIMMSVGFLYLQKFYKQGGTKNEA